MSLRIIKAGVLDTIQDTGRNGYRHFGIGSSGAMDRYAVQLANCLLGKDLHAAVIEMHFPSATILFDRATIICISGANFSPLINEQPCPVEQPVVVNKQSVLRFSKPIRGARCYLAILHDLKMERWLGSYSTHLKAGAGGWKGRRLQPGDQILFSNRLPIENLLKEKSFTALPWKVEERNIQKQTIRMLEGASWNKLTYTSQKTVLNETFRISSASDRMGLQLSGDPLELTGDPLELTDNGSLLSSAVTFGTIQLLPNGQLIILMADHQTTGGYPQVAHVIAVDLPALAQQIPNSPIRFTFTDHHTAEMQFMQQIRYLEELKSSCNIQMQQLLHARM